MMKGSDVTNLSDSFQNRPTNIILGQSSFKKFKALLHWVNKSSRTSMKLYIDGIYQATFSEFREKVDRIQEVCEVHFDHS